MCHAGLTALKTSAVYQGEAFRMLLELGIGQQAVMAEGMHVPARIAVAERGVIED